MIKKVCAVAVGLVLVLALSASSVSSATNYQPVVIANGWSPSDVGTAAPLAASLGGSVLYANADSLGSHTVDALERLKPSEVILVGGTAVLTADIVTELNEVVPNVPVTRLAGDDRIHTAALGALHALGSAIPEPEEAGAANEAQTGPGNALDYQNGYSEARFQAGTDLRPGVWQYSAESGVGDRTYGLNCRVDFRDQGADAHTHQVAVNGTPVQGDSEQIHDEGFNSIRNRWTYRFGLIDGDTLTLQAAAGDVCIIERISD